MKMLAMLGGSFLIQQPTFLHLGMQAEMITMTCKEALEVIIRVSGGHGLFSKG